VAPFPVLASRARTSKGEKEKGEEKEGREILTEHPNRGPGRKEKRGEEKKEPLVRLRRRHDNVENERKKQKKRKGPRVDSLRGWKNLVLSSPLSGPADIKEKKRREGSMPFPSSFRKRKAEVFPVQGLMVFGVSRWRSFLGWRKGEKMIFTFHGEKKKKRTPRGGKYEKLAPWPGGEEEKKEEARPVFSFPA